jgi:hypothetical protein
LKNGTVTNDLYKRLRIENDVLGCCVRETTEERWASGTYEVVFYEEDVKGSAKEPRYREEKAAKEVCRGAKRY